MSLERDRTSILKQLEDGNFNFDVLALQLFEYQRKYNPVYEAFTRHLKLPAKLSLVDAIPFLPIQFFKSQIVKTGAEWNSENIFESSGTTGQKTSRHHLRSRSLYLKNSLRIFTEIYGDVKDFSILSLLPSYLERENSSLIAMAKYFMDESGHEENGFFLNEYDHLVEAIKRNNKKGISTILLGVTFALLDFPRVDPTIFKNTIIIETGGMKGRGAEMTRIDLHEELKEKFGVSSIHSEYGMTELLSQAWSTGQGIFQLPKTMKMRLREVTDPFSFRDIGKTGVINLIDLANIDSCAFIATDDLGRMINETQFEVLGRVDGSDIRGCNLMYIPK